MSHIFSGDTIRVKATFRDWAATGQTGALVDPDSNTATVKVFDSELTEVLSGTATRESQGVYYFDWTVPTTEGGYYFEYKGLFSAKPQISRQKYTVKFKPDA